MSRFSIAVLLIAGLPGLATAADLKPERQLKAHRNSVFALALSTDGNYLLSAGYDKQIVLWKTKTWKKVAENRDPQGMTLDLAFAPNGRYAFAAGDPKQVLVMSLPKLKLLRRIKMSTRAVRVAVHRSKSWIAISGASGKIHVFDYITGEQQATVTGHKSQSHAIVFTKDGKYLYSAGDSPGGGHHLQRWAVGSSDKPEIVAMVDSEPSRLSRTSDSKHLMLANYDSAVVIDAASGRFVHQWKIPRKSLFLSMYKLPGRKAFVTSTQSGHVDVWQPGVEKPAVSLKASRVHIYRALPVNSENIVTCTGIRWDNLKVWRLDGKLGAATTVAGTSKSKTDTPTTKTPAVKLPANLPKIDDKAPQDLKSVAKSYKKAMFYRFKKTADSNAVIIVQQNGKPRALRVLVSPVVPFYNEQGVKFKDLFKAAKVLKPGLVADVKTKIHDGKIQIAELRVVKRGG